MTNNADSDRGLNGHERTMLNLARRDTLHVLCNAVESIVNARVATAESAMLADPEVVGADHGHWAASAFPDADRPWVQHLTCECGLPWIPGEGCQFVQGVRAQRLACPTTPAVPQHYPSCAYYGQPFKPGSANKICPCDGRDTTPVGTDQ